MELHAKNTPILPRKYNSIFHHNHLSRIVKVTVCVDFLGTFHRTNVMAHRLTFDEGVWQNNAIGSYWVCKQRVSSYSR